LAGTLMVCKFPLAGKIGSPSTPGATTPGSGTPGSGTPGSSAKHVRFKLKNNLYFQKGGEVPSPELRTPESCKPKVHENPPPLHIAAVVVPYPL